MSLRDSLNERFHRIAGEVLPETLNNVGQTIARVRKRLDHLNCSLAERALPEDRKRRVSELALSRKAKKAGQKSIKIREKI